MEQFVASNATQWSLLLPPEMTLITCMQTGVCVFSYQKEKAFPLNPRGGYDNPYTPSPAHPSSLSQTLTHTH